MNFFDVIISSFHFERLISQKKILRIHTSTEGFDRVYKKQYFWTINIFAEGNNFLILLQKESLQSINMRFSFWKIYLTEENSSYWHLYRRISYLRRKNILMIYISTERNHYLVFLQKELFWCNDLRFSFCEAYFTEGNSSDSHFSRRIWSSI